MKVLLAPLFFRSRFCKHCARIFYRENPGSWVGIHGFESLPPLGSFDTKRGFIPDFPTLLMFEEFVLDGEAFERLKQPGDRLWLREWFELIAVIGRAEQLLGDSPQEAQNFSWEFDPDANFGLRGEDGEVHDLAVVLHDGGESELQAHRDLFATALDALKNQLREVNSCITACDELGVAPIMWAPYRRYLEEKLRLPPDPSAIDVQAAGHQFFEIAFPAYAPTTVRAFAKLRTDRRIKALRAEILGASQKGELLDPQYPQRVLTKILRLEQKAARVRRIAGWIATTIGTIPVPGLGLAAAGISEAVTSRLEWKRRKPWHWFYLISDGRGAT